MLLLFFFSIHDWSQVFFAQPQKSIELIALAGVFYVYFFGGGCVGVLQIFSCSFQNLGKIP